jgi:phenylalanine-4-hydroxylase
MDAARWYAGAMNHSGPDPVPDFSSVPEPSASTYAAPLLRPAHLAANWLEPSQRIYSEAEHALWDTLFKRQMNLLPNRACDAFLDNVDRAGLGRGGVPDFARLSALLNDATGWTVVPVPMLIPDHVFFHHLANRRFPAGNFIRKPEEIDYIEAPDVFHDVFGHVPLLLDPMFANYMEAYGKAGWKALRYNRLKALGALYWYTVEFGLIDTPKGLRIYGAGIVSSAEESVFALEGQSPNRLHLNVDRVMRTDYCISDLQQTYFVIDSFDQLIHETVDRPFDMIYSSLRPGFQFAPGAVLETDRVYHMGTQEYALRGGRASRAIPV